MRRTVAVLVSAIGLGSTLMLAGCSSSEGDASAAATPTPFDTTQPVTTINGEVPAGELLPLKDVTTMLDTVQTDGNRLIITQGVRKAGTRAGIHVHKYGGHTCVMSGVITDFIEGKESSTWPAGTCYYMPPNIPMAVANLGTEDAILVDTFILPPGEPTITILEPGWPTD